MKLIYSEHLIGFKKLKNLMKKGKKQDAQLKFDQ